MIVKYVKVRSLSQMQFIAKNAKILIYLKKILIFLYAQYAAVKICIAKKTLIKQLAAL
ncbi:uncharacterized protein METZ01_LOCUS230503 [marine metagenome]|uniref:Uncharacterized protein n=1 Tax=marine metagenome TaxID=408172 RepID=A0A382GRM7_9ZZZZ